MPASALLTFAFFTVLKGKKTNLETNNRRGCHDSFRPPIVKIIKSRTGLLLFASFQPQLLGKGISSHRAISSEKSKLKASISTTPRGLILHFIS